MSFTTVRRRKIHEDVALQIEEAIIQGIYAEGDQLPPERELMERFGVGRPAVREALLMLERSGVVQLSAGERARVVHPTIDGLVDQISASARHFLATKAGERSLQEARRVFESAIARQAAEVATEAEIARLAEALDANRQSLSSLSDFEVTDVAFHLAIAEIGGNQVFSAMHRAIVGWLALQRRISLKIPEALPSAFAHHEAIYEAIAAHEPERAWRAMNAHIRDVERWYEEGRESESHSR
ncbi:FCD domain-containing protein [Taklimakanibacter deserti]|uniref:FCD domain-containing protein n=1 Tax=Taklimakanibacter deserti TaxID=2267839 RepID=UPI000E6592AF